MKKMKMSILLGIVVFLFAVSNASAAAYYWCTVYKITPKPNGIVGLTVIPGATETRFTGTALANIAPADDGAKNMFATILTAVALGKEVGLFLNSTPSMTPQVIDGVSLVAQ